MPCTKAAWQIWARERERRRLHNEILGSELIEYSGLGHMVHHLAPDQVVHAVDRAAQLSVQVGDAVTMSAGAA